MSFVPSSAMLEQPESTLAGASRTLITAAPAAAGAIHVEIASTERYRTLDAAWTSLATRAAEPNVYMDPQIVAAAAKHNAGIVVMLAWDGATLLGAWALRPGKPYSRLPMAILVTPVDVSCPDSTPVIDAARIDETMAAILDAIARTSDLPKIIGIELMNDGGPVMAALNAALRMRGGAHIVLEHKKRPKLVCNSDPDSYFAKTMSGGRRRKLGQLRRRLAGRGTLDTVIHRDEGAVTAAIERFLALEAAGWKGKLGRPLNSAPHLRDFTHCAVPALAARKRAEIWEMSLDGAPISMAIVLRSGSRVFDWKVAYNEQHADCSPGVLLAVDYTTVFLRDPALTVGDSSAQDDAGLLGPLWTDRQPMTSLMIDCRGGSATLTLCGAFERSYRGIRQLAKQPFHAIRQRLRRVAHRVQAE